jgi:photosystem II stability/assembly factor-like uncharacterized protein
MIYSNPRLLIGCLWLMLLTACQQSEIPLRWQLIPNPATTDLRSIAFGNNDTMYIAGGKRWAFGALMTGTSNGTEWQYDTLDYRQLYNANWQNGRLTLAGMGDLQLTRTLQQPYWRLVLGNRPTETVQKTYFDDDTQLGIAVGGYAFSSGFIYRYRYDDDAQHPVLDSVYSLRHEMTDLAVLNDSTLLAVGYGVVLRSIDKGYTWQTLAIQGDYFQSVSFADEYIGMLVGREGTIAKTTDGGMTWKKLRNPNSPFVPNVHFRKVWMVSPSVVYVVGDEGTFWYSLDGGNSWLVDNSLPNENIYDISVYKNKIYLAGADGMLLRSE